MSYVDQNLISGEKVTYRAGLHWKVFALPVLSAAALAILGVVAVIWGWATEFSLIVNIAGGTLILIAVIITIKVWIRKSSAEFAVTTKRVILKTGFIQKDAAEIFLAKIESVGVDQTILGRLLGFGSVIIRGTGGSQQPFADLSNPLEFRRQIQEQIGRTLEEK
jgi:uncharacterized membrane protein YdbT with pleckstrin-like domain